MVQYQSFPGTTGDSRTLDKLKALCLPDASGGSFLDVGCNEGFFCGFAKFQGATRSVGIDRSESFIARARARFPGCEFHAQDWETLPEGKFDIILLASALHYAEDQPSLISRLVELLSPQGVLVLELGIAKAERAAWITVEREIDERSFPSMAMLREVLRDYAWKWMGPSVQQDGDPVERHVVHVRRRLPLAYLLMEPPGLGKSSIANQLFSESGTQVLSNDAIISALARGGLDATAALANAIGKNFSPFYLDRTISRVIGGGHLGELIAVWCKVAGGRDFAMDGFIPAEHHALVQQVLIGHGYLPVRLSWDRVGAAPPSAEAMQEQAERFYFSLANEEGALRDAPSNPPELTTGFVDEIVVEPDQIHLRGWMVAPSGVMPKCVMVRIGDNERLITLFERQQRPDVQRHFSLRHDLLGFRLSLEWPAGIAVAAGDVKVFGGDDASNLTGPFGVSQSVVGVR